MSDRAELSRRSVLGVAALAAIGTTAACGGVGSSSNTSNANSNSTPSTSPSAAGGSAAPSGPGSTAVASPSTNSAFAPVKSATLNTMGFAPGDEVATSRVSAFSAAYPGVKLAINKSSFDPQQFLSAVASGNPPDVVYMDRGMIGTFVAKGALQPLEDAVAAQEIDTSQYRPAALTDVTIGGKLYGIPEFYDTRNILVNGAALTAAGVSPGEVSTTDWTKLMAVAKKLVVLSGGKPTRIGFDPKLPEFLPLWAQANGATLLDGTGKPTLDDPKVIEALQYAISLVDEQGGWAHFSAFRDTWNFFGSVNEFTKSQVGAMPYEDWYVNVLATSIPNIQLTAVPFTDKTGKKITFESGSAWAIPKGSKNPGAATSWMKTMTSTATWLAAGAAREATVVKGKSIFTGLFTANSAADAAIRAKYVHPSKYAGFDTAINAYYAAQEYATSLGASVAGSEITTAWTTAATSALNGSMKPADALKAAQSTAMSAYSAAQSS